MQLALSTSSQVKHYLERSRTIVLPMGSTEQHGPIGLIGTDTVCAQAIAQRLGVARGVLIAPPLALTVAQFNMGFPGTITVRAATLLALMIDVLHSLADQGFERVYVLNGHGANIAVARAAFQDFYLERGRISETVPRCRLRSWWEYPEVDRLRRQWYGVHEGMHATPSEISIVMAAEPEAGATARMESESLASHAPEPLDDAFLRDHAGDNHFDAASHRASFPDGRVGSDSRLARREHGEALLEAASADAARDLAAFEAEH
jgi:creatinine amidohydrolase